MTTPIVLSILIPITPDRMELVKTLLVRIPVYNHAKAEYLEADGKCRYLRLFSDIHNHEIIFSMDQKQTPLGQKREWLYKKANGEYSWQIDSDDIINQEAVELVLEAIEREHPDCVTFEELCLMGRDVFKSNHSLIYQDWAENTDGYDYVRTPFYKNVIKTTIAQSEPFEKEMRFGEDHEWSKRLKPHLKTEVHIPKQLYIYQYNNNGESHNERYGING